MTGNSGTKVATALAIPFPPTAGISPDRPCMDIIRLLALRGNYARLTAPPMSPPTRHTIAFPKVSSPTIPPTDPPMRAPSPACPKIAPSAAPPIERRKVRMIAPAIPAKNPATAPRPAPRAIRPATRPAIRAPRIGMNPKKNNKRNPANAPKPMLPFGFARAILT